MHIADSSNVLFSYFKKLQRYLIRYSCIALFIYNGAFLSYQIVSGVPIHNDGPDEVPMGNNVISTTSIYEQHEWSKGPSNSVMARVCFTICIVNLLLHNILVTSNTVLRDIYGFEIIIVLYLMLGVHCFNLATCFLEPKTTLCVIAAIFTHYTALCVPFAVFMASFTICRTVYTGGNSIQTDIPSTRCIAYLKLASIVFIVPFIVVCVGILSDQILSTSLSIGPGLGERQCGVGCIEGYQHLLYIPMPVLFILQIPIHVATGRMHYSNQPGRCNMANMPQNNTRYLITVKLTTTNFLIWLVACLANYICLSVLWHLFTLLCALQSIFIMINFSFTRHFFDVFFKIKETKSLAKLVSSAQSIPLLPVPNKRNRNDAAIDV